MEVQNLSIMIALKKEIAVATSCEFLGIMAHRIDPRQTRGSEIGTQHCHDMIRSTWHVKDLRLR
jgi:hypothetical protein